MIKFQSKFTEVEKIIRSIFFSFFNGNEWCDVELLNKLPIDSGQDSKEFTHCVKPKRDPEACTSFSFFFSFLFIY